jgi:hypothetical protein
MPRARRGCAAHCIVRHTLHLRCASVDSIFTVQRRPLRQPGLATSSWRFRPAGGRAFAYFDQLPTRGLCGGASAFWREIWSKHPLFRAQRFHEVIEDLPKFPKTFRPVNEDASPGGNHLTKQRALLQTRCLLLPTRRPCMAHVQEGIS